MTAIAWAPQRELARGLWPGVLASFVAAAAATFLSSHYGAPVMLFALLLGMAMNFLSLDGRCKDGIEWTARQVLRIGVALLGLRITTGQIAAMGWQPVLLVVVSVAATIGVGIVAARLMGFRGFFGLLTGGAVAICGASAAMALAAAMPKHPLRERATLFTVIGVSALSTLAMIVYPMIVRAVGLDATQAGIFLGGTIHDVAQVVGAGYGMSPTTGDAATFVKLLRVAMLLPVIVVASMMTRAHRQKVGGDDDDSERPPLLPWFAVGFALLVGINSTGWLPAAVTGAGNDASRWCLVAAIAAIGMKTQLRDLATVGWKPVALMLGETIFLAGLVLIALHLGVGAHT
jgi:uncharacterized integral membrane protein (TIGR00698 family)